MANPRGGPWRAGAHAAGALGLATIGARSLLSKPAATQPEDNRS